MVLALPLLLFLMALVVNFGVIAAWKVRGSSVSRFEAFRARHERANYAYPRDSSWWPSAAAYGHAWEGDISINTTVDSSALLPTGDSAVQVNTDLLDVKRGLVRGHAALKRQYTLLGGMGDFDVLGQTYLVDNKWQYHEMGLASNASRRSRILYQNWKTGQESAEANKYVAAAEALYNAFYATGGEYTSSLAPLWKDPEFLAFDHAAPDFHPSLQSFCTLDTPTVDQYVQNLVDNIQGVYDDQQHITGVAERMTQAFIALYRREIQYYQKLIDSAAQGVDTSSLKQSVADLQQEITTLETFLNKLQNGNAN